MQASLSAKESGLSGVGLRRNVRPGNGSAKTRNLVGKPVRRLLLVVLDNFRRAHMRFVWISSCITQGLALAQEIPTLIQLDIDFRKPGALGVGKVRVFEQAMLLRGELLNVLQDGSVSCFVFHKGFLFPFA
jgi:hypothetical protein